MQTTPPGKKLLIDAGIKVMSSKGFGATALKDICHEAGVPTGSFYYFFQDKVTFGKETILYFCQKEAESFRSAAFHNNPDPLERIFGRLNFAKSLFAAKAGQKETCLIGQIAHEICLAYPELRNACRSGLDLLASDFENDLAEAKSLHEPNPDFDHFHFARLFVCLYEGSLLCGRIYNDPTIFPESMDWMGRYVSILFNRHELVRTTENEATTTVI